MDKKIILVGGFHEIIELCEDLHYEIIGIIDEKYKEDYLGYPIIGSDKDAERLFPSINNIPLVVTPDSPLLREKLVIYYKSFGYKFETIISPLANVSKRAKIGIGSIIQSGVNVSSFTKIGDFVKLNSNSNVMHDSQIGDFSTIAPNAVILGRVNIGIKSYIGANSTILPNISIKNNVLVGAGAVVTKNIEDNKIVKGIPAK